MITRQQRDIEKDCGRITLPAVFLKKLQLEPHQPAELSFEYGKICIRKYEENKDYIKSLPYFGIMRLIRQGNRISVPKEYLELLDIGSNSTVDIVLNGSQIEITSAEDN